VHRQRSHLVEVLADKVSVFAAGRYCKDRGFGDKPLVIKERLRRMNRKFDQQVRF